MEINSWFDLREIGFGLSGRPSFLRATRSERKKNCEKKNIKRKRDWERKKDFRPSSSWLGRSSLACTLDLL